MSNTADNIVNIHTDALPAKMNSAFDAIRSLSLEERASVYSAIRREDRGVDGQKVIDTFVERYRESLAKVIVQNEDGGASIIL